MTTKEKQKLLVDLLKRVRADLAALIHAQQDTRAAATHEQNRAEHAKDTRATEQSYLARGLAGRVEELRRGENLLAGLELRCFELHDPIALTAIVRLEDDLTGEAQSWWLVPAAGGLEISWGDHRLRTLTPVAPLGRALLGLRVGEEGSFQTPRGERRFEIIDVS